MNSSADFDLSVYNPEIHGKLVLGERYELTSFLSQGGMGRIYIASDRVLNRTVAVKILLPQFLDSEKFVRRFEREAQTLSKINHPRLLTVYDFGVYKSNYPYIVTEYLRGVSLKQMIDERARIPVEETVELLSQVCDGLHTAHQQGITHRDLKPDNILVIQDDQQEWVKVIDFGLAVEGPGDQTRLTDPGSMIGTAAYMAPEQFGKFGAKIDARTDVYALGVVFHEMLTGTFPYTGETIHQYCISHTEDPIPDLTNCIPPIEGFVPELQAALEKALAKNPEDRYQTAADFKRDLRLAIGARVSDASYPIPTGAMQSKLTNRGELFAPRVPSKLKRLLQGTDKHRHRLMLLLLALLVAALTAGTTLLIDRLTNRNMPSAEITSLFTQPNVPAVSFSDSPALRVGIRGTANNYQDGTLKMEIRIVDLKGRALPIIVPKDKEKYPLWSQFEKENSNFGYTFELQPDDKSFSIFKTLELPYFLFTPPDNKGPFTFVVSARLLTPDRESLAIRDSDFIEAPRNVEPAPKSDSVTLLQTTP